MSVDPTLLEDLIEVVDDVRDVPSDIGYYLRDVEIVKRSWSGAARGKGKLANAPVTSILTIDPRPKVEDASLNRVHRKAGYVQEGSLFVTAVSATLTDAQIRGKDLTATEELLYRVTLVVDTIEATAVPEGAGDATDGLFRLVYAWRRGHPLGWELVLSPIVS